jgi:hypothetical protein
MADVIEWRGEIEDYGKAFDVLAISDSYTGLEDAEFPLPTRDAYEEAMRAGGELGREVALRDDPVLAAAVQAHWHAAGPNACEFARHISAHRADHGWSTVVITDIAEPREIADQISAQVRPRIEDPDLEVVSVLLPQLDDEIVLAKAIARLGGMADWQLRGEAGDDQARTGALVRLGLRVAVEFDHWSEVLGFGRFSAQANTRLAPFTEFAVRAKAPERPRRDQRAFMAHIPVALDKPEFGDWWNRTRDDRRRRLRADQDLQGKAKVTFAITRDAWAEATE